MRRIAIGVSLVLLFAASPRGATPTGWRAPAAGRQIVASASSLGRAFTDAAALAELRGWNDVLLDWQQSNQLVRASIEGDTAVAGHTHERYRQTYRGVPVWSGDLTRQLNQYGQAESIFGTFYPDIDIDVVPRVPSGRAAVLLGEAGNGPPGPVSAADLNILPSDAGFTLVWTARVVSLRDAVMRRVFIDANSGDLVLSYDDTWTQTATPFAGTVIDAHGDPAGLTRVLAGDVPWNTLTASAIDPSPSRISTDAALAALQTTNEYLRTRVGRDGLDGKGRSGRVFVNPLPDEDATYPTLLGKGAYYGDGDIVLGLRARETADNLRRVVAHEAAHGVTESSSGLIYLNESGALNEAFSILMSDAVARFASPALDGTDVAEVLPGAPTSWAMRVTGTADNGGVHANAAIVAHVVAETIRRAGQEHRTDIERVVYRAFTALLPSNATFAMARSATIQAAIDLFGHGGVEQALIDAWTAAGVD
jgi:Zn-dependent metalloprotease